MSVTAVVLSGGEYTRQWPGLEVLVHATRLTTAAGLHTQRLAALRKVKTPWCFFLDDDDDLPPDYLDVLEDCKLAACIKGVAIAFAGEIIKTQHGEDLRQPKKYDRARHLIEGIFLPHAMLLDTAAACAADVPTGPYVTESVLYWAMARKGAAVVQRPGYVWNRANGMHTRADFHQALQNSREWCAANP